MRDTPTRSTGFTMARPPCNSAMHLPTRMHALFSRRMNCTHIATCIFFRHRCFSPTVISVNLLVRHRPRRTIMSSQLYSSPSLASHTSLPLGAVFLIFFFMQNSENLRISTGSRPRNTNHMCSSTKHRVIMCQNHFYMGTTSNKNLCGLALEGCFELF